MKNITNAKATVQQTSLTPTTPEIKECNDKQASNRYFLNSTAGADGILVITRDDNQVTYGFIDLYIYIPQHRVNGKSIPQQRINLTRNNADKFLITTDDFATSASEFYARWNIFTNKVFKRTNVPIEVRETLKYLPS